MAKPESKMSCARARALLEAYLDGEVPPRRAARAREHFDACFGCGQELAEAGRMRAALRELPRFRFPDAALQEVMRRVHAESGAQRPTQETETEAGEPTAGLPSRRRERARPRGRLRRWIADWDTWRPALAAAVVVAAVVTGMMLARPRPRPIRNEAELQQAELQIRWVMAQLGDIGRRTGLVVRDEVLDARVVQPTTKAVQEALEKSHVQ